MVGITGTFDATNIPPEQGIGKHPVGKKFPAVVKSTSIESTKDEKGGYFQVTFETPSGTIMNNYNLWNANEQTVSIANKQLSALCHATGIFKLDWSNEGAAMRGGQCMIDVDPDPKEPEKYVRITKIYDKHGNEPGKVQSAPQPQQQATPAQSGWGQQPQANPPANGGWAAPVNAQQSVPAQAWTQGPSGGNPPWAKS